MPFEELLLTNSNHDVPATASSEQNQDEDEDEAEEIGDYETGPDPNSKADILHKQRLAREAVFHKWFENQVLTTTFQNVPKTRKPMTGPQAENSESLRDLLQKQQDMKRIIGSERQYQIELFERAKARNTIAVLDTGGGKTLIAILLLRHVLEQELNDRAAGKHRRVAIFVVEKVTLMFQQASVLHANLGYSVMEVYGAMSIDLWSREKWSELFNTYDCIVCTADVLLFCLMKCFLEMHQLNILIFDEAHHAKKGHPFARIMNEFYPVQPSSEAILPRIFGMTASPCDIEGIDNIEDKALQLEQVLHATIATTIGDHVDQYISRPQEHLEYYPQDPRRDESKLFRDLKDRYWDLDYFQSLFDTSKKVLHELGPWCSDKYWTFAFSEAASKKLMNQRMSHKAMSGPNGSIPFEEKKTQGAIDKEIEELDQAALYIQEHDMREPLPDKEHLSERVLALHKILSEYYERPSDARCLIFVEEKMTARLLKDVFASIGGPNMKAGFLVGSTARNLDAVKNSFKDQFTTLLKFRRGELNCIFATSVAEEGLDVPDCNVVIRFDPCRTLIQYIQSRGRARHRSSKYIHLIAQEIDSLAEDRLRDIGECEAFMRRFCSTLPEDRRLVDSDLTAEDLNEDSAKLPILKDSNTGARVSLPFSLVVLQHYVDCTPRDEGEDMYLTYHVFKEGRKFRCEITFPARISMPPIRGKPYMRKMFAKMGAALEACKVLKKQGMLDEHFLPTVRKEQHHMRNAKLALNSKDKSGYQMLLKPAAWDHDRGRLPTKLWITRISLEGEWHESLQPIGIATRTKLPGFPSFPVYRFDNQELPVRIASDQAECREIDEVTLSKLTFFTLTVFKDVFNKTFEVDPGNMPYWLAPMSQEGDSTWQDVDWQFVESMRKGEPPVTWDVADPKELENRFLVDDRSGAYRYFTRGVDPTLKATDPVPEFVQAKGAEWIAAKATDSASQNVSAPAPARATELQSSIVGETSSLGKKARPHVTWNPDQPVLKAHRILHRLNVLAAASTLEQEKQGSWTRTVICPEPLRVSWLPISLAAMALVFPAIITRVESYMIALEFMESRKLNVSADQALEAITKDSQNSDEHGEEKIDLQHGMGPNYERLEFLGDAFLKLATSIVTFMRNPGKDEHWMHVDRMRLLCNKTLFDNAVATGVPKVIRSKGFLRRHWYPPGLKLLAGRKSEETVSENYNGKTIADVAEATIGACLTTHMKTGYEHPSCMDDAVRATTSFVMNEELRNHDMLCWADYWRAYDMPTWQAERCVAAEQRLAASVEEVHPYRFKNPKLLISALTHPSLPSHYASTPSYQRLEFLGDSVLDLVCVWYLFTKYRKADPGWLTEHKMAIVSNKFIGCLGAKLGLHRHMKHQSPLLQNQITAFATEYEVAEEQAGDQVDFWIELRDPPKFFADLVESYVGAMFVDSEFNYAEVQRFFDKHILPFFGDMTLYDSFANNSPINALQDRLNIQLGCNHWGLMAKERESDDEKSSVAVSTVVVHNQAVGAQKGSTVKIAKLRAATEACTELGGLTPAAFRIKYKCTCSTDQTMIELSRDMELASALKSEVT